MTRRFAVTAVRNITTERGGHITEQVPSFIIENCTHSDARKRARLIVGPFASIDVQDVSTDEVLESDALNVREDGWQRAGG